MDPEWDVDVEDLMEVPGVRLLEVLEDFFILRLATIVGCEVICPATTPNNRQTHPVELRLPLMKIQEYLGHTCQREEI